MSIEPKDNTKQIQNLYKHETYVLGFRFSGMITRTTHPSLTKLSKTGKLLAQESCLTNLAICPLSQFVPVFLLSRLCCFAQVFLITHGHTSDRYCPGIAEHMKGGDLPCSHISPEYTGCRWRYRTGGIACPVQHDFSYPLVEKRKLLAP